MKNLIIALTLIVSLDAFAFNGKPYNQNYDPQRDPFSDFKLALQDASPDNKLILIVLGGDWCSWCHRLGSFIKKNVSIKKNLEDTFVVMKLNVSEENSNQKFLSYLPEPKGYPYFVIIDSEGKVVGDQNTGGLEQGGSYSSTEFAGFISKWSKANK